jgi:hypothetical protein
LISRGLERGSIGTVVVQLVVPPMLTHVAEFFI